MDHITVVSSGGDGSISDISFNKISAAAERNENMIQICVDNEAYMNTGIQKSGLTPYGSWTTTTPLGKTNNKKNLPFIIAQHNVPYVATVSISYPEDLKKKLAKAQAIKGFKYIHAIIPCPTGWRFHPSKTVEIGRLVVETWSNPLYEIEDGVLNITKQPKQKPIEEYLKPQGRFKQLNEKQINYIQNAVNEYKENLIENDGKKIFF
jgi:pyruvate ferredoxin oxidoreductase beta subunit